MDHLEREARNAAKEEVLKIEARVKALEAIVFGKPVQSQPEPEASADPHAERRGVYKNGEKVFPVAENSNSGDQQS